MYVSFLLSLICLTAPSLPGMLLSQFIINLRQLDFLQNSPADKDMSRLSILNFRMPTMDDVLRNLGELLNFETAYTVDGDSDETMGESRIGDRAKDEKNYEDEVKDTGYVEDHESEGMTSTSRGSIDDRVDPAVSTLYSS